MQYIGGRELGVEAVDVVGLDSAARGPGKKGFGTRADGPLAQIVPFRPASVGSLPQVHARAVPPQDGEAIINVDRRELEPVAERSGSTHRSFSGSELTMT